MRLPSISLGRCQLNGKSILKKCSAAFSSDVCWSRRMPKKPAPAFARKFSTSTKNHQQRKFSFKIFPYISMVKDVDACLFTSRTTSRVVSSARFGYAGCLWPPNRGWGEVVVVSPNMPMIGSKNHRKKQLRNQFMTCLNKFIRKQLRKHHMFSWISRSGYLASEVFSEAGLKYCNDQILGQGSTGPLVGAHGFGPPLWALSTRGAAAWNTCQGGWGAWGRDAFVAKSRVFFAIFQTHHIFIMKFELYIAFHLFFHQSLEPKDHSPRPTWSNMARWSRFCACWALTMPRAPRSCGACGPLLTAARTCRCLWRCINAWKMWSWMKHKWSSWRAWSLPLGFEECCDWRFCAQIGSLYKGLFRGWRRETQAFEDFRVPPEITVSRILFQLNATCISGARARHADIRLNIFELWEFLAKQLWLGSNSLV